MRICRPFSVTPVPFVASIIFVAGAAAPVLPAQTPATSSASGADSTFHAGTQEVLVDAVVADKKGNFQLDLTLQNFKLFEDGKEQKITSFSLESAGIAGHSSPHFLALFFESEEPGLREQVSQFVDRFAAPDLYMAVYSKVDGKMRLWQGFTSDAGRVKAALRAMPIIMPLTIRDPQNRPLLIFDRISSVAAELAPIRGRKALILFTYGYGGFRPPPTPTEHGYVRFEPPEVRLIRKAIDDCNAANVSVHSFINAHIQKNGGGTPGSSYQRPPDSAEDHGGPVDFIQDLAIGTGGKYTPPGSYDLAPFLGSVSVEQGDYYLLGYTPSADSADKPCHKLKVKVDRSGLDVNARDTYCTSIQAAARALKPA